MRLYSIQPRLVYDVLCATGVFLSEPWESGTDWTCHESDEALHAYDWLCKEMERRGIARPPGARYPVWAWQQYWGRNKPKPDLRCSDMKPLPGSGPEVLLTLDVADERVLVNDHTAWHHPLNYWHLGTLRESSRFATKCRAAGCQPYHEVPLTDPALHAEMLASWQVIFDLPRVRRLMRIRLDEQAVQATFWELRAADVVEAVEFGHGMRRHRLPLPRPRV